MFWNRNKPTVVQSPPEPLFRAVRRDDPEVEHAHAMASTSIDVFLAHIHRTGEHTCAAKLRFRDPGLSDEMGMDCFLYLWLTAVEHVDADDELSGMFFEVPTELLEWHWPGQRLHFHREDVFDWFVNDGGTLHGGFTLRLTRSRLPLEERAKFDEYSGINQWV